jgi:glycosyltransferase involved in cell wall biosynthesis
MARVCVVRQYFFPLDVRVRRDVDALLGQGHQVVVVCERRPGERRRERSGQLTVWRLPMSHERGGSVMYVWRYAAFLIMSSALVAALHVRRRFDLVQVHSLPDVLVLAGAIPRLLGARLLLDLHEVMPEFFATKFDKPLSHPLVRVVIRAEQFSIRVAHHAMTCTEDMKAVFVARGADPDKITVVLNSADESIFDAARYPSTPDPDRFTLICHGSIEARYGLDLIVEAVAQLEQSIPEIRFDIFGQGEYREELRRLVASRGLEHVVAMSEGFVPIDELLGALSRAHIGVIAMRQDAFRDLTHCHKMYEYLALGIPVVTSRTRSVGSYFPDTAMQFFRPGDAADLARAIRELYEDPTRREALVVKATEALAPYRWPRQREIYDGVVDQLLRRAA